MSTPLPVLIVGDAVSAPTGLGRITAAIAERADASLKDVCRIATLGYGGPGSRKYNFFQYSFEDTKDFMIPVLPDVWEDWAGNERGVIFFIWDASRLGWFSRPNTMCPDPALKQFLTSAKIERWIYCPIDAEGPWDGRLSYPVTQYLRGFDRILAYGAFGENVLRKSLGDQLACESDLTSIPHGIDSTVFYPRDRQASKRDFTKITGAATLRGTQWESILDEAPLIGVVATNQARKDWGLWAEVCALFLKRHPTARFWIHTDMIERDASISSLLVDFGLLDSVVISLGYLDDDAMAQAYSACDLTLGIGAGEGFGYPIAESLFCGTPVVHGKYAGAVDYLWDDLLVDPAIFQVRGSFNTKRPIFNPKDWFEKMESLLWKRVVSPSQLDWCNVWPRFEAWFRKGLAK
jgi:glycosyltransferase involved in cell wall biosynthesis